MASPTLIDDWKVDTIGASDYSEIPPLDENFWKNAKLRLPPSMELIQVIVDKEVAAFFKQSGKRINYVLKDYVEVHR